MLSSRKITIFTVYAPGLRTTSPYRFFQMTPEQRAFYVLDQEAPFFLTEDEARMYKNDEKNKLKVEIFGINEYRATTQNNQTYLVTPSPLREIQDFHDSVKIENDVYRYNNHIFEVYEGRHIEEPPYWAPPGTRPKNTYIYSLDPITRPNFSSEKKTVFLFEGRICQPNYYLGKQITINTDYNPALNLQKLSRAKYEAEVELARSQKKYDEAQTALAHAQITMETVSVTASPRPST